MKLLNDTELSEIDGGLGLVESIIVGVLVGAAINVMNNWDDFKAGVIEGYNNH